MEFEEHRDEVEEYFEIIGQQAANVPAISTSKLEEALYAFNELGLWWDDVDVSKEQAILCWRVVEKVMKNGFPEKLTM